MTDCTLVVGADAAARETAIAARLDPRCPSAVILEGQPAGVLPLQPRTAPADSLHIAAIAAGCPCCDAGLVMRVTLDRMLRLRPALLYISLAGTSHLPHLQDYLQAPPYSSLVRLQPLIDFG